MYVAATDFPKPFGTLIMHRFEVGSQCDCEVSSPESYNTYGSEPCITVINFNGLITVP